MANWIAAAVLLTIIGFAVRYVVKAKKSGRKCIGCPEGCCPSRNAGGCSCGCGSNCD